MLAVLFSLGDQRCGLDSAAVERIVPAVPLRGVGGPAGVAGAFSYHGASVPVVDVVRLVAGHPARAQLSSRIILARTGGAGRLVGLLAERVDEVRPLGGKAEGFRVVTLPELVPAELLAQLSGGEAAP